MKSKHTFSCEARVGELDPDALVLIEERLEKIIDAVDCGACHLVIVTLGQLAPGRRGHVTAVADAVVIVDKEGGPGALANVGCPTAYFEIVAANVEADRACWVVTKNGTNRTAILHLQVGARMPQPSNGPANK